MITELEDGLKLLFLVLLAICLWRILSFMLNVGWYTLILH
jgi:nitrate reductase NapE component